MIVPKKKRRQVSSRYNYPEWYTVEIIRDIRLKSVLHKLYKSSGSSANYEAFSQYRSRVKRSIAYAHKKYQQRVENEIKINPKSFWNYAKSKRGGRSPKLILKNGKELSTEQCAQEFAEYFFSVYSTKRAELNVDAAIADAGTDNSSARVHIDQLQLAEVRHALQQLKPKKSMGPDGIPPYIF